MRQTQIFKDVTEKLNNEVIDRSKAIANQPPNHWDDKNIKIEKSFFNEAEWNFLLNNENNFKTIVNKSVTYPVYIIKDDVLCSNEISVTMIQTKFVESY